MYIYIYIYMHIYVYIYIHKLKLTEKYDHIFFSFYEIYKLFITHCFETGRINVNKTTYQDEKYDS